MDLNFPNGGTAAGRAISLRNNKLVTASFKIVGGTETEHLTEDWLTNVAGSPPANYQPPGDISELSTETQFNQLFSEQLSGQLDSEDFYTVRRSRGIALEGKNFGASNEQGKGAIILTGSRGDRAPFGYRGCPFTRLIGNNPNFSWLVGQTVEFVDGDNDGEINISNFNTQQPVNLASETSGPGGTEQIFGIFYQDTNIRSDNPTSFGNEGGYFASKNNVNATNARDGKIHLGHGIEDGYHNLQLGSAIRKMFYDAPSYIYPYIRIQDIKKEAISGFTGVPRLRPFYRVNGGSKTYTSWYHSENLFGTTIPNTAGAGGGLDIDWTTGQDIILIAQIPVNNNLERGDYITLGYDINGGGFHKIGGDIYIGLTDGFNWTDSAGLPGGFTGPSATEMKNVLNVSNRLTIVSDSFPIQGEYQTPDSELIFTLPGRTTAMRQDSSDNPFSDGPDVSLSSHRGMVGNIDSTDNSDPDIIFTPTQNDFEEVNDNTSADSLGDQNRWGIKFPNADDAPTRRARLSIFLETGRADGGAITDIHVVDQITSGINGVLSNVTLKGKRAKSTHDLVRVRISITDQFGNDLRLRATQGWLIANNNQGFTKLEEFETSDQFNIVGTSINADPTLISSQDLSVLFGQHKETLDQSTLTDGGSFNQSMSLDNIGYIQEGEVPELITSMSNIGTTSDTFGDVIHLASPVLITSSIGVTASYEAGAIVSASYQSPSNLKEGLYEVTKLIINTNEEQTGGTENNIPDIAPNTRVSVAAYVDRGNGVMNLIDTKQTQVVNGRIDLCEQEDNRIKLGLFHSDTDTGGEYTASFHVFTSNPSDANDPVEVRKGQGFVVERIEMTRITSSNELKLADGTSFSEHLGSLDPNEATEVRFESPHLDVGAATFPFTFDSNDPKNNFTASIAEWSADYNVATLDTDYLITESFTGTGQDEKAALFTVGPFPLSAHFDFTLPAYSTLTNELEYSYNTTNHNADSVNSLYQFDGDFSALGGGANAFIEDTVSGEQGIGVRVYKGHNSDKSNIIAEDYSATDDFINLNDTSVNSTLGEIHHLSNKLSSDRKYRVQFLLSGAASPKYPDGVITGSDADAVLNIKNFYVQANKLSGSKISNIDPGDFDGATKLILTSSHPDDGDHNLFSIGQQVIDNITETADGKIQVPTTLFITASSEVSGAKVSLTPGEEVFDYITWNNSSVPINGVTEELLGATFTYNNFDYTITNILGTENEDGFDLIELNNGVGTLLTTTDDSGLGVDQSVSATYFTVQNASGFTMGFKNTHLIFENEFHCTVNEDEFTHTLNTSARKYRTSDHGDLADFATGSKFRPYVTTVGLYNDEGELLVVGKLAQPVRTSTETDTTFVVRYDT